MILSSSSYLKVINQIFIALWRYVTTGLGQFTFSVTAIEIYRFQFLCEVATSPPQFRDFSHLMLCMDTSFSLLLLVVVEQTLLSLHLCFTRVSFQTQ